MIDWHELFAFSTSPLELMVRGTVVYGYMESDGAVSVIRRHDADPEQPPAVPRRVR